MLSRSNRSFENGSIGVKDWQIGLLISVITAGLGGIAAAIRWGVKRITHKMDGTDKVVSLNTDAMIKNTESNAVLSTKIDSIAKFVKRARTTPPEGNKIIHE